MGNDPWNRNEGRFDRPSSAVPTGKVPAAKSGRGVIDIDPVAEARSLRGIEPVSKRKRGRGGSTGSLL
ncbi:hypothetical protein [Sphingomonas sp. ABOLE]|uniref:hypothetical protein n=1 Tax=Sphingomonas sp. ABOLE TaxID=1985878 RepID=UPI0013E0BF06|nr:hypothetical protein [Sphingomonas sp. ABOLE]